MPTNNDDWIHESDYRLCRGNWRLESFQMTPVGLGIKVGYNACNLDTGAMWSLLDLLHLIREIALQANCLMPIIVRLPMSDTEGLRRRQDLHRGRYLLLDSSSRDTTDLLLHPQPVDIRLEQEKYLSLADIRDKAEQGLNSALYKRLFETLPVLPEKGRSQDLLKEWREVWEKRLLGRGAEGDSVKKNGVQHAQKDFLTGLGRIKKCSISNFKGIKKLESIDLNADIILVTGANGNGKSSFVEALSLALTGYHPAVKPVKPDKEPNEQDKGLLPGHFFHYNAEEFSIELVMEAGAEQSKTVTVIGKKGEIPPSSPLRILRYPSGVQAESEPVLEELNFRLTSYLPEHVNLLFDENVKKESQVTDGTADEEESSDEESPCRQDVGEVVTVRDLFPSLPLEAEALCHAVQGELGRIKELKISLNTQEKNVGEKTEKEFKKARDFFTPLSEQLNILLEQMNREKVAPVEEWQQPEPIPREFTDALEKQKEALRPALDTIDKWSLKSFETGLDSLWERYSQGIKSSDIAGIADRLSEKEQNLKRIEVQLEGMEGLSVELEQLQDIFDRLGEESFCRQSSALLKAMGMQEVAVEVDWLDPARAHRCAQELAAAGSRQAKELQDNKDKLEKEIKSLEARYNSMMEELPAWKSKEEARALIKRDDNLIVQLNSFAEAMTMWEKSKQELKDSREVEEELRELADFLEEQRADLEKFRWATEQSLNGVLKRFVMAGGVEADDVEVTSDFRLLADKKRKDEKRKRNLNCLSSGQKAQLAMAWMVACRELMHNSKNEKVVSFPHRVMIMDDPSTTFDLSNLHSQAVLWRQLAYNEDPTQRYQIFIVSHHEEFSSRLLDLLCPPGLAKNKECRMKLLRFTDWTVKDGAKVKTYNVEPAPKDIDQGVKLFRTGLKYLVKGQE